MSFVLITQGGGFFYSTEKFSEKRLEVSEKCMKKYLQILIL